MLCDRCGKNATVYVKQIINGKESYLHLCQDCAGGLFNVGDLQLGKLFSVGGFGDSSQEQVCPCCGSTYSDFKTKGRLGCSQCYSTFALRLAPTIKNIHGKTQHLGKIKPKLVGGIIENQSHQLEDIFYTDKDFANQNYEKLALQKQLDELVKAENFEDAVVIRDKIKDLEAKIMAKTKAQNVIAKDSKL